MLENSSIQDYLLKIRTTADVLAFIRDYILCSHHIDVILEWLPSDYALVICVIKSKFGVIDLDEVKIILLAHKLRLIKFKKQRIIY